MLYDKDMSIQNFIGDFLSFLNTSIVPFIFALAFLFFLWNAYRYFIVGGTSEEGQRKAKSLMIWGLVALVIMVSIWAIVNIFVDGFGIGMETPLCPDYLSGDFGNNISSGCF